MHLRNIYIRKRKCFSGNLSSNLYKHTDIRQTPAIPAELCDPVSVDAVGADVAAVVDADLPLEVCGRLR